MEIGRLLDCLLVCSFLKMFADHGEFVLVNEKEEVTICVAEITRDLETAIKSMSKDGE